MMSAEYWNTKGINPPKNDPLEQALEQEDQDKIKLGSRNPRRDLQQMRVNRQHQESINEKPITQKNYGNGGKVEVHHKEHGDPFPHQCRYYEGCDYQVKNSGDNRTHFDRCHPLVAKEETFYSILYNNNPNGKKVYKLALLYGRSEDSVKQILFKNGIVNITKWGRRAKEIGDFHHEIRTNRPAIEWEHKQLVKNNKDTKLTSGTVVDYQTGEILNSIPSDLASIRNQNYLTPEPTENILDAIKNIIEENKALKEWKLTAESLEQEQKEVIQRLQDHNQKLEEWIAPIKEMLTSSILQYPDFTPAPEEPPTL